jgi:TRAP-type C4-dicarboxylate transport system permease small subunit
MSTLARPSEIRLKDPLSEVTRQERKTLLGVCAIVITIAKTGLIPSKISALGVEFDQTDQRALLHILLFVVIYFSTAFLIYATSDLVAWQVSFHNSVFDWRRARALRGPEEEKADEEVIGELQTRGLLWRNLSPPVSFLRSLFEFVLPLGVALYAVIALQAVPVRRPAVGPISSSHVGAAATLPTPTAQVAR